MRRSQIILGILLSHPIGATVAAQEVPTQGNRPDCFELVAVQLGVIPGAPMLINKCTGITYVLTRRGNPGQRPKNNSTSSYVWVPIDVVDKPGRRDVVPVPEIKKGAKVGSGKKCFTYDNRTFCE